MIATEILNQIGNKALCMIGAKQISKTENAVQFKIGRNPKQVNFIKIELTKDDLYDMTYSNFRNYEMKKKSQENGIYADMLHESIERNTGMATSL